MDSGAFIDLERYPLTEPAFLSGCRETVAKHGCCHLPGFLNVNGLRLLTVEAGTLRADAHHSDRVFNPWYREPDKTRPATDPRSHTVRFAVGYVARDHLAPGSPAESLFRLEPVLDFVQHVLDAGALYRFDDSRGSLNYTVMNQGEELGWHFDECEAVASIALSGCEGGGRFDYIGPLDGSEAHIDAHVVAALGGDESDMVSIDLEPGDFLLFRGRDSLHRVTSVEGVAQRVMLLMSYDNVAARADKNRSDSALFDSSH
jgi:hypothetical protein